MLGISHGEPLEMAAAVRQAAVGLDDVDIALARDAYRAHVLVFRVAHVVLRALVPVSVQLHDLGHGDLFLRLEQQVVEFIIAVFPCR